MRILAFSRRSVRAPSRLGGIAAIVSLTIAGLAVPAAATGDIVARDISFPQCDQSLPRAASASFGVLGTNNGTALTRNPCLTGQLAWAKSLRLPPAFYANTGNPGPQRARRWPIGQTTPKVCRASDPNSLGCSYDYGWIAGSQSLSTATDAAQQLHHVDRENARRRVANVDWWLDVETMNSWQALDGPATRAAQQRDVATLAGQIAALARGGRRAGRHLFDGLPVGSDHRRIECDAFAVRRRAAVARRVRVQGVGRGRVRAAWLHRRTRRHDAVPRERRLRR